MRALLVRTAAVTALSGSVLALSALTPAQAYDDDASCGSPAPGVTRHQDNQAPVAGDVSRSAVVGVPITIDLSDAISDPDGDVVSVVGVENPKHGSECQQGNEIRYVADEPGTEQLTYGVTDGAVYRTGALTIDVRALDVKAPTVVVRTKVVKKKVTRSSTIRFSNIDPDVTVDVYAAKFKSEAAGAERSVDPGKSVDFHSKARYVEMFVSPYTDDEDGFEGDFYYSSPVVGYVIDTVTGKVRSLDDEDGDWKRRARSAQGH